MKEPDARIKQVNRSLSLSGIEWHRDNEVKTADLEEADRFLY